MVSQCADGLVAISAGSRVRIRPSYRTPYSGQEGTVTCVDTGDSKGAFLVQFEDGTQFRYNDWEIETHLIGRT
jgi:hypothetical protein